MLKSCVRIRCPGPYESPNIRNLFTYSALRSVDLRSQVLYFQPKLPTSEQRKPLKYLCTPHEHFVRVLSIFEVSSVAYGKFHLPSNRLLEISGMHLTRTTLNRYQEHPIMFNAENSLD